MSLVPAQPGIHVTIKSKPDRLENPAEFVADDFADEDIQPAIKKLAPICDEQRRRSFEWHYEAGEVVRERYEALKQDRANMYGERFFYRLARDLNKPGVDAQLLGACYKLVKRYNWKEYREFIRHPEISPTHVLQLVSIPDAKIRENLFKKVITDKLTTKQLFVEAYQQLGVRRKPGAGRPLKVPKKIEGALTHFETQIEQFVKLSDQVWFGDQYNIISEIKELPATELTEELRTRLDEDAKKADNLAVKAAGDAKALREALADVDRRIAAQAKINAEVQAEEEAFQQQGESKRGCAGRVAPAPGRSYERREIGRAARAI